MLRPSWSSEAGKNVTMKKWVGVLLFVFSGAFAAEVDLPHSDDWKNEIYNMRVEFENLERGFRYVGYGDWKRWSEIGQRVLEIEESYILNFYKCYHAVMANSSSGNIAYFLEAYNLFLSLKDWVSDKTPRCVGCFLRTQKRLFNFPDPYFVHGPEPYSLKEWYEHCYEYLKILKSSLELQLSLLPDELL
jgi:hypothetical protein